MDGCIDSMITIKCYPVSVYSCTCNSHAAATSCSLEGVWHQCLHGISRYTTSCMQRPCCMSFCCHGDGTIVSCWYGQCIYRYILYKIILPVTLVQSVQKRLQKKVKTTVLYSRVLQEFQISTKSAKDVKRQKNLHKSEQMLH